MKQKSIEKKVSCLGVGLHSGTQVELSFHPAKENTGIVFAVNKGKTTRFFKPGPESVVQTNLATTIAENGLRISTVEHLLGAVRGLEIDNLLIELSAEEVPIMDGSADYFVQMLKQAGIKRLNAEKRIKNLKKPFCIQENGKMIRAEPAEGFFVKCVVDFDHPLVGRQNFVFKSNPDNFVRYISRARTFGFLKDVEKMKKSGLAQGGSLDNALVFDSFGVVNPEGMRYPDEPVRHKLLDFIGDLALVNYQINGYFEVHCSGHEFNNNFIRELMLNSKEYLQSASKVKIDPEVNIPKAAEASVVSS